MASTTAQAPSEEQTRRRPLQAYNSFPRPDPVASVSEPRNQASTIEDSTPNARPQLHSIKPVSSSPTTSIFDSTADGSGDSNIEEKEEPKTPADFDELPLELVSLSDTFIDSLTAKVHSTPPTVDRLASLFQDFYVLAAQHINTHISLLSSRQNRFGSASSSSTSLSSKRSKGHLSVGSKDKPKSIPTEAEQQLLTAEELVERKKARKALEKKRLALEEAVERRVTEKIYDRIWRHRSTQDEEQDEKLRSKTAALAVVGIGLSDLGVDLGQGEDAEKKTEKDAEKEKLVKQWLEGAREELRKMDDERSPLGKLQKLKAAHKCIVETLSHFHPSSSADEIMPMLIYTLITSPPEGIDVISNLYFIQRFRSESKIDGEAAYCLTNLEAAITFLETVDLSSLRADELQSGPAKLDGASSGSSTPKQIDSPSSTTSFPSLTAAAPAQGISAPTLRPALIIPPPPETKAVSSLSPPMPARPSRRLSELLHPAQALASGGKDAVLNTAEGGLKTIGNSLGQSYDFLIGKLKERQESLHDVLLPKTLEDARKLVDTDEDDWSASEGSSLRTADKPKDDKLISMISGRPARDRSIDSAVSGSSAGKKVGFFELKERPSGVSPLGGNPATQVAEGIRMLSSTFNPLNKFAQIRAGFGRSAPTPAEVKRESPNIDAVDGVDGEVAELTKAFPDLAGVLPKAKEDGKDEVKKEMKKIDPPIQRFMDVRSPGDLKLSEVVELLRDYRRLAGELKELGAI